MDALIKQGPTHRWVEIDRQYGGDDDVLPVIVILNEGFDGLRIAVFTENLTDTADVINEQADSETWNRFERCDEDGLFHHWGKALCIDRKEA